MHPFFAGYFDQLQEVLAGIAQTMEGLPQEAVDWSPGQEMNSLAILIAHVAGATRFWIGDVVGQAPSGRDRAAEFQTQEVKIASLQARLEDARDHARQVLEKLDLADLTQSRTSPRHGRTFTVGWALVHTLEHAALHLGHAQILRQLWDQRKLAE